MFAGLHAIRADVFVDLRQQRLDSIFIDRINARLAAAFDIHEMAAQQLFEAVRHSRLLCLERRGYIGYFLRPLFGEQLQNPHPLLIAQREKEMVK